MKTTYYKVLIVSTLAYTTAVNAMDPHNAGGEKDERKKQVSQEATDKWHRSINTTNAQLHKILRNFESGNLMLEEVAQFRKNYNASALAGFCDEQKDLIFTKAEEVGSMLKPSWREIENVITGLGLVIEGSTSHKQRAIQYCNQLAITHASIFRNAVEIAIQEGSTHEQIVQGLAARNIALTAIKHGRMKIDKTGISKDGLQEDFQAINNASHTLTARVDVMNQERKDAYLAGRSEPPLDTKVYTHKAPEPTIPKSEPTPGEGDNNDSSPDIDVKSLDQQIDGASRTSETENNENGTSPGTHTSDASTENKNASQEGNDDDIIEINPVGSDAKTTQPSNTDDTLKNLEKDFQARSLTIEMVKDAIWSTNAPSASETQETSFIVYAEALEKEPNPEFYEIETACSALYFINTTAKKGNVARLLLCKPAVDKVIQEAEANPLDDKKRNVAERAACMRQLFAENDNARIEAAMWSDRHDKIRAKAYVDLALEEAKKAQPDVSILKKGLDEYGKIHSYVGLSQEWALAGHNEFLQRRIEELNPAEKRDTSPKLDKNSKSDTGLREPTTEQSQQSWLSSLVSTRNLLKLGGICIAGIAAYFAIQHYNKKHEPGKTGPKK